MKITGKMFDAPESVYKPGSISMKFVAMLVVWLYGFLCGGMAGYLLWGY